MGLLAKVMNIAADGEYVMARDLIALAYADGKITQEEKEAVAELCRMEEIPGSLFVEMILHSTSLGSNTIPTTRKAKEEYLAKMIQMMGADADSSSEEIILLEMMAARLGFNRLQLISLILQNTTQKNFPIGRGIKVLRSFLNNVIDPTGRTEEQNHSNIAKIYDAIAKSTASAEDPYTDRTILIAAFDKATQALLTDDILVKEYRKAGVDFRELLEYESSIALKKWSQQI